MADGLTQRELTFILKIRTEAADATREFQTRMNEAGAAAKQAAAELAKVNLPPLATPTITAANAALKDTGAAATAAAAGSQAAAAQIANANRATAETAKGSPGLRDQYRIMAEAARAAGEVQSQSAREVVVAAAETIRATEREVAAVSRRRGQYDIVSDEVRRAGLAARGFVTDTANGWSVMASSAKPAETAMKVQADTGMRLQRVLQEVALATGDTGRAATQLGQPLSGTTAVMSGFQTALRNSGTSLLELQTRMRAINDAGADTAGPRLLLSSLREVGAAANAARDGIGTISPATRAAVTNASQLEAAFREVGTSVMGLRAGLQAVNLDPALPAGPRILLSTLQEVQGAATAAGVTMAGMPGPARAITSAGQLDTAMRGAGTSLLEIRSRMAAVDAAGATMAGPRTMLNTLREVEGVTKQMPAHWTPLPPTIKKTTDEIRQVERAAGGAVATMGSLKEILIAIGVASVFGKIIAETRESERVVAQLDAVLQSTGNSIGISSKEFQDMAASIQKTTAFSDEQVIAGQAILLQFNTLSKEVFPQAQEAMVNLAQRMGRDTAGAAQVLGMAMDDPVQGANRLRRAGIILSETQKEQIASFIAVGDKAGAQKVILDKLSESMGGAATAYRDTLGGALDSARNAFGDLFEALGTGGVSEALKTIAADLRSTAEAAKDTSEGLGKSLGDAITGTYEVLKAVLPYWKELAAVFIGIKALKMADEFAKIAMAQRALMGGSALSGLAALPGPLKLIGIAAIAAAAGYVYLADAAEEGRARQFAALSQTEQDIRRVIEAAIQGKAAVKNMTDDQVRVANTQAQSQTSDKIFEARARVAALEAAVTTQQEAQARIGTAIDRTQQNALRNKRQELEDERETLRLLELQRDSVDAIQEARKEAQRQEVAAAREATSGMAMTGQAPAMTTEQQQADLDTLREALKAVQKEVDSTRDIFGNSSLDVVNKLATVNRALAEVRAGVRSLGEEAQLLQLKSALEEAAKGLNEKALAQSKRAVEYAKMSPAARAGAQAADQYKETSTKAGQYDPKVEAELRKNAQTAASIGSGTNIAKGHQEALASIRAEIDGLKQLETVREAYIAGKKAEAEAVKAGAGQAQAALMGQQIAAATQEKVDAQRATEMQKNVRDTVQSMKDEIATYGLVGEAKERLSFEHQIEAMERQNLTKLTAEQRAELEALYNMQRSERERARSVEGGATDWWKEYSDNATNYGAQVKSVLTSVTNGIEDLGANALAGNVVNWQQWSNQILMEISKVLIRAALLGPMMKALGGMLGGSGGDASGPDGGVPESGGGGWGGILNMVGKGIFSLFSAKGNVFDQTGHVRQYAKGGVFDKYGERDLLSGVVNRFAKGGTVVSRATRFTYGGGKQGEMGEAGAEAIMPLVRGPSGSLGVKAYPDRTNTATSALGAAGATVSDSTTNVRGGDVVRGGDTFIFSPNITVDGSKAKDTDPKEQEEFGQRVAKGMRAEMEAFILETLQKQRRPGAMLGPGGGDS